MTDVTDYPVSGARHSDTLIELINGQAVPRQNTNYAHQKAVLTTAAFMLQNAPKGVTNIHPLDVVMGENLILKPDVFWVSKFSEKCALRNGRWIGAPDVVVEVLTPVSVKLDRGVRFDVYERAGVREYWLLDPVDQYAEIHRLERGQFIRQGLFNIGDSFRSTPLGIQVAVGALCGAAPV